MAFVQVSYGPFYPVSGFMVSRRSPVGNTAADVFRYPHAGGVAPVDGLNFTLPAATTGYDARGGSSFFGGWPLGTVWVEADDFESPYTTLSEDVWQLFMEFDVSSVPWGTETAVRISVRIPAVGDSVVTDFPYRDPLVEPPPSPITGTGSFLPIGVRLYDWTRAGDDTDFIPYDDTDLTGWTALDSLDLTTGEFSTLFYRDNVRLVGDGSPYGRGGWTTGFETAEQLNVISSGTLKVVVGPNPFGADQSGARLIGSSAARFGVPSSGKSPSVTVTITIEVDDPEPEYLGWVVGAAGWGSRA